MSDRVAGKDTATSNELQLRKSSKAHLLESEVTHWTLATSLEREGVIKRPLHGKVVFLQGR